MNMTEKDTEGREGKTHTAHANLVATPSNLTSSMLVPQVVSTFDVQLDPLLVQCSVRSVCSEATNQSLRTNLIAHAHSELIEVAGVSLRRRQLLRMTVWPAARNVVVQV